MFKWFKFLFGALTLSIDNEGGGPVDRGDSFTPTPDTKDEVKDEVKGEEDGAKGEAKEEGDDGKPDEKPEKSEKKADDQRVPRQRLNEVIKKNKDLIAERDERIKSLEEQLKSVATQKDSGKLDEEIEALESQLEDARADGNKDKVRQLAKEIRVKERQIAILESTKMTETAKTEAREDIKVELLIEQMEEKYPQLNPDSDEYDEDLVRMILDLRDGKQARNMPPSQALRRAVTEVMERVKPAAPEKGESKKPDVAAERKKEAVKKSAEAASKQPASLTAVGDDSDKTGEKALPNIMDMNADEYEALPEATKRRLRGDAA